MKQAFSPIHEHPNPLPSQPLQSYVKATGRRGNMLIGSQVVARAPRSAHSPPRASTLRLRIACVLQHCVAESQIACKSGRRSSRLQCPRIPEWRTAAARVHAVLRDTATRGSHIQISSGDRRSARQTESTRGTREVEGACMFPPELGMARVVTRAQRAAAVLCYDATGRRDDSPLSSSVLHCRLRRS
jgi:hypothetical protein